MSLKNNLFLKIVAKVTCFNIENLLQVLITEFQFNAIIVWKERYLVVHYLSRKTVKFRFHRIAIFWKSHMNPESMICYQHVQRCLSNVITSQRRRSHCHGLLKFNASLIAVITGIIRVETVVYSALSTRMTKPTARNDHYANGV